MLKNLPKAITCSRTREEELLARDKKMIAFFFQAQAACTKVYHALSSSSQNNLNDDTKSALRELHLDHEQDLVITCDM